MAMFSPTVAPRAYGGSMGGLGSALFHSAANGMTLHQAINQRALDDRTLGGRIDATNAGNANRSAWGNYGATQGQTAMDAFNQNVHKPTSAFAPSAAPAPTPAPAASQTPAPTAPTPQPAPTLQNAVYGQQTSTPVAPQAPAPASQTPAPAAPQAPAPAASYDLRNPFVQMALNSGQDHPAPFLQGTQGAEAATDYMFRQGMDTPEFHQAVQGYLNNGMGYPAAFAAARAAYGMSSPLADHYGGSEMAQRDMAALNDHLQQALGYGMTTGDFDAANHALDAGARNMLGTPFHGAGTDKNGDVFTEGADGTRYVTPFDQGFLSGSPQDVYNRGQNIFSAEQSAANRADTRGLAIAQILAGLDKTDLQSALRMMGLGTQNTTANERIRHDQVMEELKREGAMPNLAVGTEG